jgi:hypothetical protein
MPFSGLAIKFQSDLKCFPRSRSSAGSTILNNLVRGMYLYDITNSTGFGNGINDQSVPQFNSAITAARAQADFAQLLSGQSGPDLNEVSMLSDHCGNRQ